MNGPSSSKEEQAMGRLLRVPAKVRVVFWASATIALAAALRRLVVLARPSPSGPPNPRDLDALFASHAALTLLHIFPAMVFIVLVPLVCFHRASRPGMERWLMVCGTVTGLTAYALALTAVGGWLEQTAVVVFDSLFLFALFRFQRARGGGDWQLGQRWLIRAVGVLLGIATTRPVMAVFFATRPLTHLGPEQFFGMAFWIGFSINTIAVEVWVRSRYFPGQRAAA